jgi:hypothetical protein
VNRQNCKRALWLQIDSTLSSIECDSIDIQTVEVVLFIAVEVCPTPGCARRRETFYLSPAYNSYRNIVSVFYAAGHDSSMYDRDDTPQ